MLFVIFELRIDWYTNKAQTRSTMNEMKYSGIPIRSLTGQYLTHPHHLIAAGVPATPQKSLVVTSND